MEHGPNTTQRDADPAPGALADLRPDTPQQRFDLAHRRSAGVGSEKTRDKVRRCRLFIKT